MARFRRIRRTRSSGKRYSRKRGGFKSGIMGDVLAGAAIGVGAAFIAPISRQYVPSIMGIRPESLTIMGVPLALKFLHKGGKFTNAALIIGSSMVAKDLIAGYPVGSGNSGSTGAGVYG